MLGLVPYDHCATSALSTESASVLPQTENEWKGQRNAQSIESAPGPSGNNATPTTRRVRPAVPYLRGLPAQSWIDALSRKTITLATQAKKH
jgi:hypothetical protein